MSNRTILLLSGPNLDLFGTREPEIYGHETLDDHVANARSRAESLGFALEHLQTASEAEMVKAVHDARGSAAAIVINAAAFSHYAWSLHDALAAFAGPIIELHVSNPQRREDWRHSSVISPVATGIISGLGAHGYELAIDAAAQKLAKKSPE